MAASAAAGSSAPAAGAAGAEATVSGCEPPPFSGQRRIEGDEGKFEFVHNGARVYSWEQTLEEVLMYIQPPPGTPSKAIECIIRPESMRLGLKGNPPFLSAEFSSVVVASESFWMISDGLLTVNLQKARKGETWAAVFKGHAQLDELSVGEERKALMLERFQAEHAGFDFSGAEFSGAAPDPQTFMGACTALGVLDPMCACDREAAPQPPPPAPASSGASLALAAGTGTRQ